MSIAQNLTDKVVLITGGSKGIGRAIAQRVAAAGARVVINYSRDAQAAEETLATLGPDASRHLAVRADASTLAGVGALVDAAAGRFGRLDVVVANAGSLALADLAHTTEAQFDAAYALNVKGPFFLAQRAAPHLPAGGGGRLVFLSSGVARNSALAPAYALYVSTKGAVEQLVRALAKDLARQGVTVNAVAPGPTATELFMNGKSEEMVRNIQAQSPFNRLGTPEDIANLVAFVAGPESAWISGQVIGANGAAFV
ncbi:NAD(P)-binding protein [Xylariomycetidae sp. FL0641]|nr:NAD(P)-binding protein [Xylariomycetidae sp. FL0641]